MATNVWPPVLLDNEKFLKKLEARKGDPIMADTRPTLSISVEGRLVTDNGTVVTINKQVVQLHQPGLRGGQGPTVVIPIDQWDTVSEAVATIRDGMARASAAANEAARVRRIEGPKG